MANKKPSTKFTVAQLLDLALDARQSIKAGRLQETDEVYLSLEVLKDGDESTYANRVHGGEIVQVCLVNNDPNSQSQYVHIQLMGEPNFKVYPD